MLWRLAFAGLLAGSATAAGAAEKIAFGPAPAWVKPVALPTPDDKQKDAAIRILVADQQSQLEPGRTILYTEMAYRLQTPQGLSAGSVTFAWRPETDSVTVHKLVIRRGDKVIDVLASGQTFSVMRRETNLESAMLDGMLTAHIQPEGLQVGDIVDVAFSVSSSDPVLKGHLEQAGTWNGLPVQRAHLRASWPSSVAMRFRETAGLPPVKPVKAGGTTAIEISQDNLEPLPPPKGAPLRYHLLRLVELSDFASWAELAALFEPLYDKAAAITPGSPLDAELARIKAASPDPAARTEAALALVQDRVRYVALAMGEGGLVPADAETTWSRRFGDCKGKTALLLALLHGLGVEAEPVVVNAALGDGLDQRLPMVALFNHVLVRAHVGGRTYWLDGTRTGDKHLAAIRTPAFRWGLPLLKAGAALVPILPAVPDQPDTVTTLRLDASNGISLPAAAAGEMVMRGDEAQATNVSLGNLSADARERTLREFWHDRYDFITVKSVGASFDPATGEERLTMTGEAKMDWSWNRYETDGTGVGYRADFTRDGEGGKDAPFAVAFPFYHKMVETILLPGDGRGFSFGEGAEVAETVAGVEYRRHAALAGNVFTIEASERSVAPEFPAAEAEAAQAKLRKLAEKTVYLSAPADYAKTDKEVAAILATTPTTAAGFVDRGLVLMRREKYAEAIAEFDRAAALDPKNSWAFANRGLARIWKGDVAEGQKDLDAADAINPRNAVVYRGRALAAMKAGKWTEAVAAFSKSLELDPNNEFALRQRAYAYQQLGDADRALADTDMLLKLSPGAPDVYLFRANILRSAGREEQALQQAAAAAAARPDDVYAHLVAGRIYGSYRKRTEALAEIDKALAIKREPYVYLNRAAVRPKQDVAGRAADIDAALRLDPKNEEAIAFKARLLTEAKDFKAAVALLTSAIAASPDDADLRLGRAVAYAKAGMSELAEKDFAAARAKASTPTQLNSLCWAKATGNVALESALSDCNAALAKAPDDAAYLDSRALVEMRLGKLDEAIADYSRAIEKRPGQTASLFGRALAWARKGDKAKSAADAAAALKLDPDIADRFAEYGLTL